MIPIILGTDLQTNLPYYLNPDLLRTHLHAIGATGSGKSTLIVSIVKSLLRNPRPKCALFLVDPVGNLSQDLLTWMADRKTCPQHVADRLVYLEPANEKWVLPFHPLRSQSEEHLYYQAGRSMEIVLRGWASQNVEQMPRLRYWTFACFFALAAMGLPLAASRWLLRPGTDEHKALLKRLPDGVRSMWAEILGARGGEALKQLESTRSRLTLFADCGILRRMFGVAQNRFDVARFIRERRIVLVNVGSYGILDQQIGKTIGGFVVNEVIQTAMSLTSKDVNPTYLVLDEFQHFVGPDLYEALPLVRQLGLRLILAHQSFSQLERGDIDLTGIIWQARSRLMFANSAKDASIIAEELAKLTFDPYRLKDLLTSERQLIVDFRRELMKSSSYTHSDSTAKESGSSRTDGASSGESRAPGMMLPTRATGQQSNAAHSLSEKTGHADAHKTSFSPESIVFLSPLRRRLESHSGAKNVCPQTVPDPGPTLVPEVVPDPGPALGRPGPRRVNDDVCCMLFAHQPFRGSPGLLGVASSSWLVSYVAGAVNQLFAEAHTDFSCRHWSDGPRPRCYETSQGGLATRRLPHR